MRWRRRLLRVVAVLLVVGLSVWFLRVPILEAIGNHLIAEDPVSHVDEVFVLGGDAMDRGEEAARLYHEGVCRRFVCTGSQVPGDLKMLNIDLTESDMTRIVLVKRGVPADSVLSYKQGTSTYEESRALLALAKRHGVDSVMIVSSPFHLRRARFVFEDIFSKAGITVLFHGAPNPSLDEALWWRHESSLLMVFSEYVKLLYYHLKY